jgi:NTE family protein
VTQKTAVILAGAVAKGAYEAGVLEVLAPHAEALGITRVIGASAGALNASLLSIGLRTRTEVEVARSLVELWSDAATWHTVVDLNLRDIWTRTGLATADRVLDLMRRAVEGLSSLEPRPVTVTLVVTALAGRAQELQGKPATTFEGAVTFADQELDERPARERLLQAALASAAFPVVFAPVDVPGIGPCVDGGAVNNAPVRLALEDPFVSRIVVVTPEPLSITPPEPLAGLNLLGHIAEILINERVFRDLHAAEAVNGYLAKLDALRAEGVATDVIERVKGVFGWRPLEIVQIRPERALRGNAFEAFGNHELRREYIATGREAARNQLRALVA